MRVYVCVYIYIYYRCQKKGNIKNYNLLVYEVLESLLSFDSKSYKEILAILYKSVIIIIFTPLNFNMQIF